MVGENFEIFMSEMPTNVVNCRKSDSSPPGRYLKIQIPPKTHSPQALWKVTSPQDRTPLKILISPQNFGIFQRFLSGGEVTFQSAWGGRVLVRNLNFQISAWGGSLIFDNLQCFQAFQTWKFQNFLQPWWIKAKIPIYICSGIIIWCSQIWMKIHEKVVCGGEVTFENAGGEIVLGRNWKF